MNTDTDKRTDDKATELDTDVLRFFWPVGILIALLIGGNPLNMPHHLEVGAAVFAGLYVALRYWRSKRGVTPYQLTPTNRPLKWVSISQPDATVAFVLTMIVIGITPISEVGRIHLIHATAIAFFWVWFIGCGYVHDRQARLNQKNALTD